MCGITTFGRGIRTEGLGKQVPKVLGEALDVDRWTRRHENTAQDDRIQSQASTGR